MADVDPITELVEWQIRKGIRSGEYQPDTHPRPRFNAPAVDFAPLRHTFEQFTAALAACAPLFATACANLTAVRAALRPPSDQ
jgi:hypothetical protein